MGLIIIISYKLSNKQEQFIINKGPAKALSIK